MNCTCPIYCQICGNHYHKSVGSIKIDSPNLTSMARNTTLDLGTILNGGAISEPAHLVWTVSDTSFATVDENGIVKAKNKIGMVILVVRDELSGKSSTIVVRIT
jgi:hypothetical protein